MTTAASLRWCPGHSTVVTDGSKEVLNGVAALLSTVSDGLSFVDPIDGVRAVRRRPQHSCSLRCLRTKGDRLRAAASGVVPVRCAPLSSLRSTTGTGVPLRSKHRYQSTPDFPWKRCATGTSQPFGSYGFLTGTSDGGTAPFPRSSTRMDAVFSLKLETRLRKEKSIRGGGTKLRFHPRFARSESCSVVGAADTSSVSYSTVASLRRLAPLTLCAALRGPTSELALLALQRPTGALSGAPTDAASPLRCDSDIVG